MASPLALAIQKWEYFSVDDNEEEILDIMLAYCPGISSDKTKRYGIDLKKTPHRLIKTNIPLPLLYRDALERGDISDFPHYDLLLKKNQTQADLLKLSEYYYSRKKNQKVFDKNSKPMIKVQTAFVESIDEEPNDKTKWYPIGELPTTLGMASQIFLERMGNPIRVNETGKLDNVLKYASSAGKLDTIYEVPVSNGKGFSSKARFFYETEDGSFQQIDWPYVSDKETVDALLNMMGNYLIEGYRVKSAIQSDWYKLTALTRVGYYLSFLKNINRIFDGFFFNENYSDSIIKLRNAMVKWKEKDFQIRDLEARSSYKDVLIKWDSIISSWSDVERAEDFLACFVYALGRKYLSLINMKTHYPIIGYFAGLGTILGRHYPGYGTGLSLNLSALVRENF